MRSDGYVSWEQQGLCTQVDPDLFFPDVGHPSKHAKKVCVQCPVITECLDHALKNTQLTGVWGGTTHRERLLIRRPTSE